MTCMKGAEKVKGVENIISLPLKYVKIVYLQVINP